MRRNRLAAMVTTAALVAAGLAQPATAAGDDLGGSAQTVIHEVLDLTDQGLPLPDGLGSMAEMARSGTVSTAAIASSPVLAGFNTVRPDRILDTRSTVPVGPKGVINLQVAGTLEVPATADAVVMNVTAVEPTIGGYLTVWPADLAQPTTSSLNMAPNRTVANLVVVKLSAGGAVSIFNDAGQTHVLADVVGWAADDGHFVGLPPDRLLDTRPTGQVNTNSVIDVTVLGRAGVPASGVGTVVVNVTATNPTAGGYVTVWPTGSPQPNASSLNFAPNQTVPNLVYARVGTKGRISLFNEAGTTDLLIDVVGYVSDTAAYIAMNPIRLMDTRSSMGDYGNLTSGFDLLKVPGPIGTNQALTLDLGSVLKPAVESSLLTRVAGVVLNVTGVAPTSDTYLTVSPGADVIPNTSTLNLPQGAIVPNAVVVKPGLFDLVSIYNANGQLDVIVDLVGIIPRQNPNDAIDQDNRNKYHVVYVQGRDSVVNPDAAIAQIRSEVDALDNWFALEEQAGRHFNIDREDGEIEVDYVKYEQFTTAQLVYWNVGANGMVLRQLVDDGYGDGERRLSLVYFDGNRNDGVCGIRIAQFTTLFMESACGFVNGSTEAANVGTTYGTPLVAVHEMVHGLGAVPSCAPHYINFGGGHVGTLDEFGDLEDPEDDSQTNDLMYPYLSPSFLPKLLDIDRDDYFDHDNANCPDVADSPFISPADP